MRAAGTVVAASYISTVCPFTHIAKLSPTYSHVFVQPETFWGRYGARGFWMYVEPEQ